MDVVLHQEWDMEDWESIERTCHYSIRFHEIWKANLNDTQKFRDLEYKNTIFRLISRMNLMWST